MLQRNFNTKFNQIKHFAVLYRNASETRNKSVETLVGLKEKPNLEDIKHDWIGPPDKESNIRPILRHIPENETSLQTRQRLRRDEVLLWSDEFWRKHNKRFYEEKGDFLQLHKNSGIEVHADKLSEFYKAFLDKNRKMHIYYNISWYLKNFELLFLSMQVNLQTFVKKFQRK